MTFLGDVQLMYSSLLIAAAATVPATTSWSPKIAIIMIICNIIAIAFAKSTIKHPNVGDALPSPELFGGMGLGALLGATSLGHILGTGVILALANSGAI